MRFAQVPPSKPEQRAPATEILRRLLTAEPARRDAQAVQPAQQEVPVDLDQRVRLVGEW